MARGMEASQEIWGDAATTHGREKSARLIQNRCTDDDSLARVERASIDKQGMADMRECCCRWSSLLLWNGTLRRDRRKRRIVWRWGCCGWKEVARLLLLSTTQLWLGRENLLDDNAAVRRRSNVFQLKVEVIQGCDRSRWKLATTTAAVRRSRSQHSARTTSYAARRRFVNRGHGNAKCKERMRRDETLAIRSQKWSLALAAVDDSNHTSVST